VYARSATFHGVPGNVDAGITFVRTELAPVLARTAGCRGLSMLVDRRCGQCIVTTSWESEWAMYAGDGELRPFRERARHILGGSAHMDEWEIVVMHRTDHGASCRVSWLEGDVEAITEGFRVEILPGLERAAGFCSVSLLVNRTTGLGCATTVWEAEATMAASRPSADEIHRRIADDAQGRIVDVHEFDLAYAHLHIPELA
jgi:hypothetical protein